MQYFKYLNEKRKGERYFAIDDKAPFPESERCVQVVLSAGAAKKGRNCCVGIFVIKRMTMLTNYAFLGLIPCTKKEYDSAFKKGLKLIQQK